MLTRSILQAAHGKPKHVDVVLIGEGPENETYDFTFVSYDRSKFCLRGRDSEERKEHKSGDQWDKLVEKLGIKVGAAIKGKWNAIARLRYCLHPGVSSEAERGRRSVKDVG